MEYIRCKDELKRKYRAPCFSYSVYIVCAHVALVFLPFFCFPIPPTLSPSLSLPPILIICYMSHFLFRKLYTTVLYIRLYLVTDYARSVHRVPKSESAHNYYRMSRLTRNRDLS